jgi:SAM-dependent methyltransferase
MGDAIARLFDAMAPEYDVLEPWYEHFYTRLHAILAVALASPPDGRRRRALDAGCGHGFQTALLQALGYETHGVDLAAALLDLARARVPRAELACADVMALPYPDGSFDVVSCCGSTLSFVTDPDRALAELARVLRPGGRLLLECEHKWSLDLAWTAVSALTRDALGYGTTVGTLWRALRRPLRAPIVLPYPGYGALTLFSARDLRRRLAAVGLRAERAWGIHAITNLIPSTVLHRPRLPRPLAALYRVLRAIDTVIAPASLANSLVVLAVKAQPATTATAAPAFAAER